VNAASTRAPELIILSRARAECYEPRGVEVCISITDPESPEVRLSDKFAAVLRLNFSDVDAPGAPEHVLFAAEHAEAIVRFVAQWPNAERVVVHCMAGVSRSPGVALGLCDLEGWPTEDIEQRYPAWNHWVRRVLATTTRATPDV
jgi:predicted protein tyrosine phosphatase